MGVVLTGEELLWLLTTNVPQTGYLYKMSKYRTLYLATMQRVNNIPKHLVIQVITGQGQKMLSLSEEEFALLQAARDHFVEVIKNEDPALWNIIQNPSDDDTFEPEAY